MKSDSEIELIVSSSQKTLGICLIYEKSTFSSFPGLSLGSVLIASCCLRYSFYTNRAFGSRFLRLWILSSML
jgi:hypothetical protein